MKKALFSSVLCLFFVFAHAQSVEIGISGGAFLYSGDLSKRQFGLFFEDALPGLGAFVRVPLSPWLSTRLGANFGRVQSQDANTDRALHFRSPISEAVALAEISLPSLGGPEAELRLIPFLAAGVGVFQFNPQGQTANRWVDLQPLGTEGQGLPGYNAPYLLTQLNFPVGMGLRLVAARQISIGLEVIGRKLFTDYLDDVSDVRVNYRDVLSGNGTLAARMSLPTQDPEKGIEVTYRRGGPFVDWYYFANISLGYHIGGKSSRGKNCYRF